MKIDKIILFIFCTCSGTNSKYLEGYIDSPNDWVFLARFCFLSDVGTFEYHLEFNENQGDPNLLLYYDTIDQWPSVYKTNKTCLQKEAALHRDQIVNLTVYGDFFPECAYTTSLPTTPKSGYTIKIPTLAPTNVTKTTISTRKPTQKPTRTTPRTPEATIPNTYTTAKYYSEISTISNWENLESTSTEESKLQFELLADITTETILESSTSTKSPIKKRHVAPRISQTRIRHKRTVVCHFAKRFRSSRAMWWFVALSNCNSTKGIHIKYKILMTNGPPGDYWHEHFSADEFYILPILMAFSMAYIFLLLGLVLCSIELKSRQLLHTTYKIFCVSVMFQLFGILFQSIAYLKIAVTGIMTSKLKRIGAVMMGASETCFLLLLLLLAKGFTVTRGRLSLSASVKLTIFMCSYIVTYICIFIYESQVFDPGEVLYTYESPAGYGLIILRVMAWGMFIYSTIFTLKHYSEKANFYYPFNVCGTLWFIAGPAFILSANTYIDKWVRESVVCAVILFIAFGGHLSFLILTMPSVANKNFPYHVRTTQIGVLNTTEINAGNVDQFNHHAYEPTVVNGTDQTIIVPLTRRTEEIFEGMYNQRTYNDGPTRQGLPREKNAHDAAIENVLNWSLAKNIDALQMPKFSHKRYSLDSTVSKDSENQSGNSRRASEITQNITPKATFDDYVKDVPVELFTISKMVPSVNNSNKNS